METSKPDDLPPFTPFAPLPPLPPLRPKPIIPPSPLTILVAVDIAKYIAAANAATDIPIPIKNAFLKSFNASPVSSNNFFTTAPNPSSLNIVYKSST